MKAEGPYLVTGAAGAIGRAILDQLLAESHQVIGCDLPGPGLDELAGAAGVSVYPCDLADADATAALVEEIAAAHPALSGFVHVAGNAPHAPVEAMSDEDWNAAIEVHLGSAFRICRASVPLMGSGGGIVFISSTSIYGSRFMAGYAAAKIGMVGLARTLAIELGPRGIRANVVAPGPIDTPLLRVGPPEWIEKLPTRIPLGRLGQPDDIADVATFLLSDRSSFLTGQCVVVDGGFTLGG